MPLLPQTGRMQATLAEVDAYKGSGYCDMEAAETALIRHAEQTTITREQHKMTAEDRRHEAEVRGVSRRKPQVGMDPRLGTPIQSGVYLRVGQFQADLPYTRKTRP